MAHKIFDIYLDIMNSEYQFIDFKGKDIVSGDTDSNIFNIFLLKDYQPVNASGNTVVITFEKPDKKTVYQNLTIVDANTGKYTCTLSSQTIIVPGEVKAEVILYEGAKRLTTTRFKFPVRKPLLNENTVESSNEFSALTEALGTVNQYDGRIADNEDNIAAHNNESIHQGMHSTFEATSTDDATSFTDAPLKSDGGLAVAKKAYIGGQSQIQETYFYSFQQNLIGLVEKKYAVPNSSTMKILVSRTYGGVVSNAGFIEAIVLKGNNFNIIEIMSNNKTNVTLGDIEIVEVAGYIVVRKTEGVDFSRLFIKIESNRPIDEVQ